MSVEVRSRSEEGQALIQVTLTLVVLLGFVALAIDVGRVYAERRNMQNAADAAALASAQAWCRNETEEDSIEAGEAMLVENGVQASAADGAVTRTDNIFDATAVFLDFSPIVGQLIGWGIIEEVGATASAACGAATSSCGLWPVALSESAWSELTVPQDGKCVERIIAVWNDDENDKDDPKGSKPPPPYCEVDGNRTADLCDCYDCSALKLDGDPVYLVASEGRGWLDFSSIAEPGDPIAAECTAPGYGTSELNCQLLRNVPLEFEVPQCVEGIEGVRASTRKPVEERAKTGDYVRIPLFGNKCGDKMDDFEVTSFGCTSVAGWKRVSDLLLPKSKKDVLPKPAYSTYRAIKGSEKVILAKTDCNNSCVTSCGSTNGTVAGTGQVRAVSLIK